MHGAVRCGARKEGEKEGKKGDLLQRLELLLVALELRHLLLGRQELPLQLLRLQADQTQLLLLAQRFLHTYTHTYSHGGETFRVGKGLTISPFLMVSCCWLDRS